MGSNANLATNYPETNKKNKTKHRHHQKKPLHCKEKNMKIWIPLKFAKRFRAAFSVLVRPN